MNLSEVERIEDLDHEQTARFVLDIFHRIIIHYALWFNEVRNRMGMEKALNILNHAFERNYGIQMKRLSKVLGFAMKDNLPQPLLNLSKETMYALMDGASVNWLANDGVWFQAVEFSSGMEDARRCNELCWAQFSPYEAWTIKKYLNLSEKPGIEGLKKALNFRVYARINTQSIVDEGPDGFVLQMNECRVQSARRRKGLDDHHCKSAGLIEYSYFARAVDSRIQTECIACPPDEHPEEWYCAWRFKVVNG